MGLVSRYVAHMSLRHDGACYSTTDEMPLEAWGTRTEEFLPSAREGPQG